jgi:hypothetical protein
LFFREERAAQGIFSFDEFASETQNHSHRRLQKHRTQSDVVNYHRSATLQPERARWRKALKNQ